MKGLRPDEVLERVPEKMLRSRGVIPKDLALFQDHFPKFPVLPGVLSLEILKCSIENCLEISKNRTNRLKLIRVDNVRFQQFLRPGETWECQVTRISLPGESPSTWTGTLRVQARRAMTARLVVDQAL